MGSGSRNYAYYYSTVSIVYLAISLTSFTQTALLNDNCTSKCPMLINGGPGLDYTACLCTGAFPWNETDLTDPTQRENVAYGLGVGQAERQSISLAQFKKGNPCYFCDTNNRKSSGTLYPCARNDFDSCTNTPDYQGFRPTQSQDLLPQCKILMEPGATMRDTLSGVLYAFAFFYLLMGILAALTAAGFFVYVDKWNDDFGNLSRCDKYMGFIAKNAPAVVRILNFFVLFFVIFSMVLVYNFRVCEFATNDLAQASFFAYASAFSLTVLIVWIFGCIFGTAFDRLVAKDTPFYAPRTPTESSDGKCYKCCVKSTHFLVRTGP